MVERPDAVLIGIPLVVASGYVLSILSRLTGFTGDVTRGFELLGYSVAFGIICWAVWLRTDRGG